MKAIRTTYKGPTDTRGARILATDEDGNRVSIPYPHELSGEHCHREAVQALCSKMGWAGRMTGGGLRRGYVFVFVNYGGGDGDAFAVGKSAQSRAASKDGAR